MEMEIAHLRPYQQEIALAVIESVRNKKGLTFSVEIARQGGKNELSAQIEEFLLFENMFEPVNIIKCAPTFNPQCLVSMRRLEDRLEEAGLGTIIRRESGNIIRLGDARCIFLSADEQANVVGNTAHLLLEIDESQDVSKDKYTRDFRPMGASTNVTVVHYGTTWDDSTLLEEVKQSNLALERRDGRQRHFRYDWEQVAGFVPDYRNYVNAERERLGENHPLFMTQYRLLPVRGGGGLFSPEQLSLLTGSHSRCRHAAINTTYVAGIDIAGEAEMGEREAAGGHDERRDSTVLTIAELDFSAGSPSGPLIRVFEHRAWRGVSHASLYPTLVDLLKNTWRCRRIVVDATGMGEPVASFLQKSLGGRVLPFKFTAPSKSELGYNLVAAVNAERVKLYKSDSSSEYRECMFQLEKARATYRPSQALNFSVDPAIGHDDYLVSLALCVEAAEGYHKRTARGIYV